MAKNWSMKEATKAILAGEKDAIVDIGRRFPLTANAIAKMGNNEGAIIIINALPEHISARKIESVLKDGVQEIEDDEEVVEEVVEEKKPAKKEKVEKAKKEKKAEKPAKKAKNEEEDFMNEADDVDELNYEAMSEVELFKICKKKGLKPEPKQNKKYYLGLLNPVAEEESDDWDDEEEEKPVKKSKKEKPAKEDKKSKKAKDDDEEDWDI